MWRQGRLIDHLRNSQMVGLEDLQTLVLDEADRLLEMGFADEVLFVDPLQHLQGYLLGSRVKTVTTTQTPCV